MAKVRFDFGAEIDPISGEEFRKGLEESHTSWFREMARGVKHLRMPIMRGIPLANTIDLGDANPDAPFDGPREGFVWAIQRISIRGTAPDDFIEVWRGQTDFIVIIATTPGYFYPGKLGLILHPGETLRFHGTAIASTSITITGDVLEVPGPTIAKLMA